MSASRCIYSSFFSSLVNIHIICSYISKKQLAVHFSLLFFSFAMNFRESASDCCTTISMQVGNIIFPFLPILTDVIFCVCICTEHCGCQHTEHML